MSMSKHSLKHLIIFSIFAGVTACGESPQDDATTASKGVDDFTLGQLPDGKSDATSSLLSAQQLKRLEDALLDSIDKLNAQVTQLEADIASTERENERKYQEVVRIERDIASREQELRNRANNNLFLCAFFPNPATCSVVVMIDNDQRMKDYKYNLQKAKAERTLIERKLDDYKREKTLIQEQIQTIRATKDTLLGLYKTPNIQGVSYNGEHPALNSARYKIELLTQVRDLTKDEIIKLQAIQLMASSIGAALDETLKVVGQLSDNVDQLIQEQQQLFMDLLTDILFPGQGPSTVEKLLDAQVERAVKELLEDYDWPLAELLRHMMGITNESSDELYQNILDHYAALRFEYTDRPGLPILDHETTSSSITVPDSLKPTELLVRTSITHSARGDLMVTLHHEESGESFALHTYEGGFKDNIRKVFTLDASKIEDTQGTWTLSIYDKTAEDQGKLVYWTLSALQSVEEEQ